MPPLFPRHRRRRPPGLLDPAPAWEPPRVRRGYQSCPRLPAPSVPAGAHLRSPVPALLRDALGPCPLVFPALSRWVEEARPEVIFFAREGPFFPPDCLPSGPAVPLAGGSHLLRRRLTPGPRAPLWSFCTIACACNGPAAFWPAVPACLPPAGPCPSPYAPRFSIPCRELYTPYGPPPLLQAGQTPFGTSATWAWGAGGSWRP